jgi:hypothetical protein
MTSNILKIVREIFAKWGFLIVFILFLGFYYAQPIR